MANNQKFLLYGVGVYAQENLEKLETADLVITRGEIARDWLDHYQLPNLRLFDKKITQSLGQWKNETLAGQKDDAVIAYLTPITPIIADQVVFSLCQGVDLKNIEVGAGDDLTHGLIYLIKPFLSNPLVTLDSISLENKHYPPFSADNAILVYCLDNPDTKSNIQDLFLKIFPSNQPILTLINKGNGELIWQSFELIQLSGILEDIAILFVPPATIDSSLESFQEVIAHLRAPEDGCPWDKKQTHSSLRTYLLEETYEALDALDKNDVAGLKEELGDILLQILLHTQIASENQEFKMADVISGINRKIIYRHPHVFKDWVVDGEIAVVKNWESLKEQERVKNGDEHKKGMLDGVPISFPALAQAQAIQDRAARVGFDWPEINPVLEKVMEELEEVKSAPDDQERAKELGDLLFAVVNLIRWHKVDAESALRQTNLKFRKRFAYIEEQARLAGKDLQKMTLAEMDVYWEQAKPFDD